MASTQEPVSGQLAEDTVPLKLTPEQIASHLFSQTFISGLKIYGVLYIIPTLIRHRHLGPVGMLQKVLAKCGPDVVRSTIFLCIGGSGYAAYNCLVRHLIGYNTVYISLIAGHLTSLTMILCERKSRRPELALYTTNQMLEVAGRCLVDYGYVRHIRYAVNLMFALSVAVIMYFVHHPQLSTNMRSNLRSLLSFFLGINHGGKRGARNAPSPSSTTTLPPFATYVIVPALRGLAVGYGIRAAIGVLSALITAVSPNRPKRQQRRSSLNPPSDSQKSTAAHKPTPPPAKPTLLASLKRALFSESTLRTAAFVVLMTGGFRAFEYAIRRMFTRVPPDAARVVAGAVAGFAASRAWPNHDVLFYFAIHALYALSTRLIPWPRLGTLGTLLQRYGAELFYIVSTGLIYYFISYEPWNVRPSYIAFWSHHARGYAGFHVSFKDFENRMALTGGRDPRPPGARDW